MPFIELESVDSTNNYALGQISAGLAQHGTAFFAREQVSGKGQRGKIWLAPGDSSLILSIVIDPAPLLLHQQNQLSICTALSVCQFFNKYVGGEAKIKWPNDIYWHDRKAGGILIENLVGGNPDITGTTGSSPTDSNWRYAVVGVGMNLNQESFPTELKNAVSLLQITGRKTLPVVLAQELCAQLNLNFSRLIAGGFTEIYAEYLKLLYKVGEVVKFRQGARTFEARIITVLETGKLVVQHAFEEEFWFGELEWVLA